MAHYAFVKTELKCPHCGSTLGDMAWIKWGYCGSNRPVPKSTYAVGDPLNWRSCADGSTPKWVYFEDDGGANIGGPAIRDLTVRDWGQTFLEEKCPNCGQELGGAAVEIRDGVIRRAWLASRDEFDSSVYVYTPDDSGALQPRPDLDNHAMVKLAVC
jgi:predicted RNA-binding Zn-ribbon protein involved in translation (DUF1610 family)